MLQALGLCVALIFASLWLEIAAPGAAISWSPVAANTAYVYDSVNVVTTDAPNTFVGELRRYDPSADARTWRTRINGFRTAAKVAPRKQIGPPGNPGALASQDHHVFPQRFKRF